MPRILFVEIQKSVMLILESYFHFCLCVVIIMFVFECLYHKNIYLYSVCMGILPTSTTIHHVRVGPA